MLIEANTAIAAPSSRVRSLGLGLIVAVVALLALVGRPGDAKAGLAWCASDPIISVNGQDIQIWVNVPSENLAEVRVASVEIHVPRNADARLVLVDQTYFPERVVIKRDLPDWNGKDDLVVEVTIRIDTHRSDLPAFRIGAEVIDAAGTAWYDGSSDQDLSFTAVAVLGEKSRAQGNSSNARSQ